MDLLTYLTLNRRFLSGFTIIFLILFMGICLSVGAESDVDCLKNIRDHLEDPLGFLNTWNFENDTNGFICKFTGIECWHPDENKVLNIKLTDMHLKGVFPRGLANCKSLTGLDLSHNKLYGEIPSDIGNVSSYLTTLDLSSNNFSGEIPASLANSGYLSSLKLDYNQLTGQIPPELGLLPRIKTFTVTHNQLSGPVPIFRNSLLSNAITPYANNPGLCGYTSKPCTSSSKKSRGTFIAGATVGAGVFFSAIALWYCYVLCFTKTF